MRLQLAIEASWDHLTAYRGDFRQDNPAYGQCYPTSRVVQWFYPDAEIVSGKVWTGLGMEHHFWNAFDADGKVEWVDLSWKQFPQGSLVRDHRVLNRDGLGDSEGTLERCSLLLQRVQARLAT